jgi:hypothetical protein
VKKSVLPFTNSPEGEYVATGVRSMPYVELELEM